ncbi:MAG: hypothetical protein K2K98_15070 [Muribaculaceae bacterium]|nr:hypothetical protein [Muribaculaceae bacterium]
MQPIVRNKSLRGSIVRLQPGEELIVSTDKVESVRSICSTLGLSMQRKYKTQTDRKAMSVTITRIY